MIREVSHVCGQVLRLHKCCSCRQSGTLQSKGAYCKHEQQKLRPACAPESGQSLSYLHTPDLTLTKIQAQN